MRPPRPGTARGPPNRGATIHNGGVRAAHEPSVEPRRHGLLRPHRRLPGADTDLDLRDIRRPHPAACAPPVLPAREMPEVMAGTGPTRVTIGGSICPPNGRPPA